MVGVEFACLKDAARRQRHIFLEPLRLIAHLTAMRIATNLDAKPEGNQPQACSQKLALMSCTVLRADHVDLTNVGAFSLNQDITHEFADIAVKKIGYAKRNPLGFFILTMMAGAYVGVGIVLILTLGNEADPASQKLIMGSLFGITLTLIVFAGAELFSGHIMYMTFGFFYGKFGVLTVIKDWIVCWYGNLFGAMMLSFLVVAGNGSGWVGDDASLVHQVAELKMNSPVVELIARAIICNWLICLAIWMSARTKSDTTKCLLIFWCLFAFVAAGFEHGIANMTVFTISLLGNHPASVTVTGGIYNLAWVSVGNIIGGAGFIGVAYYLTANPLFGANSGEGDDAR